MRPVVLFGVLLVVNARGEAQEDVRIYPRSLTEVQVMVQVLAPQRGSETQDRYLARLRQYRYLCGIPYENLVWDEKYADLAYHASLMCAKLNQLTHTPSRPAGVTDEQYELGREGASKSNLNAGSADPATCVDRWMDDSDPKNIDRVGHRRWCLNPSMGKTGFGSEGSYAAMYVYDRSVESVPDWDFVAYPAAGYMPAPFFGGRYAWSVSLNPRKFGAPAPAAKVTIQPVTPGKFAPFGAPLKLDYLKVDISEFWSGPAIIFRPAAFSPSNDGVFRVEISGLTDRGGSATSIKYVVHFVRLARVSGPEAAAVYTKYFKTRYAAVQEVSDRVDQIGGIAALVENEFLGQADPTMQAEIQKCYRDLLKDPALKREHEAAQLYRQVAATEQKAGKNKRKLAEAALAYRDLASAYRETRAGKRAATDFDRLKRAVE